MEFEFENDTLTAFVTDMLDGAVSVPVSEESLRKTLTQMDAYDRVYELDNDSVRTIFSELASSIVNGEIEPYGDMDNALNEHMQSVLTYTGDLINLWLDMQAGDAGDPEDTGAAPSIEGMLTTAIMETLGNASVAHTVRATRSVDDAIDEYEEWCKDNNRTPYVQS